MKNYAGTSIASDRMDYVSEEPISTRLGILSQASDISERLERVSNIVEIIEGLLFGERCQSEDPKDGGTNSLERLLGKSHFTLIEIEERLQNIVERLK
jgi:hypothetical protein